MAETLRDLVVSLSLNADNFSKNVASINKQTAAMEARFKLAGVGVENFEETTAGMANTLANLQTRLGQQRAIVNQYERALAQAQTRLVQSKTKHEELGAKLDAEKQKRTELNEAIQRASDYYNRQKKALGENDSATIAAKENLDALKAEYTAAGAEVKKLEGDLKAQSGTMQRCADNVSVYEKRLDTVRGAIAETEAAIKKQSDALAAAESRWTKAADGLAKYGKGADTVSKKMLASGKVLTQYVTGTAAALGAVAATTAVKWESAFAGVQKTVSGTPEQLAELKQGLIDMSTQQVPTNFVDLSAIAENAGQLKIARTSVQGFTRVIADLGETTDMTTDQASKDFAQFANITQMPQTNFDRLGATVVDLGNNSAATERDIMAMAMNIGSAGNQVGMTQAKIMGTAASLASLGLEAQAGGTAISKTIIDMAVAVETGNEKLKDFAGIAGMSSAEFSGAFKEDAAGALATFIEGLSTGKDSALKMLDEMGITETRMRDALLRASGAGDLFRSSIDRANAAWKENTALAAEAGMRYGTTESRLEMLRNQGEAVANMFGEQMIPYLEDGMDAVGGLVEWFGSLDEATRDQIITWAGYAAAAGPVLMILGKLSQGSAKLADNLAKAFTASAQAGGGLAGLGVATKTLLGPVGIAALSVAALAAAGAWIDYATGAKAAREALEKLNKTAKEWENTNANTAYEGTEGLGAFGLDSGDFGPDSLGAKTWLDTVRGVWADGKQETDKVVAENVDAFTQGSDKIRAGLKGIQASGGMSGALGDMDEDLTRLGEIDKGVEKLLKKRQNGTLTEDDLAQLQALYDEREAIRVRYQLVADAESGFDAIAQGVEAALSRKADAGDTWANAYAAATQGLGTFTQGLNQEYDARYKVIAAMEEGKKKQQALGELQAWYNEQALNGAKAYYAALKQSAQETGVFDQGGKYEATIDQLDKVSTLIGKVSKGEATETELTDALSGLDEANVLEVTAALADMQSAAKQAGETLPSDMQGILTAIENIKTAYQTTDNVFNESLTNSLKKMFGEGMDAEVYEIHATLNADGLNTSYNAWAAGTHADIIPTIDTTGVTVDGVTATISVVTGDGGIFTIKDFTLNPLTGHVETVTADGKTMSIRDLTLNPEKGHVTVITADGKALPIDDLTIDPQTGTVTALTSDGETLTISIPEKDQLSGTLVAIAEGAGVVKPVIQLQGEVAEVSYKPGDKFSNSGRPDLEYNKGSAALNKGGESWITTSDIEVLNRYAEALKQYDKATAALDGLSPLDDNYEELSNDLSYAQSTLDTYNQSLRDFALNGEAVAAASQYVANGLQLLSEGKLSEEDGAALQAAVDSLMTILSGTDYSGTGTSLAEGIADGLTAYGWNTDASTVSQTLLAALNGSFQINSPSKIMNSVGKGVSEGIGEGMKGYSFSSEGGTVKNNLKVSLNTLDEMGKIIGKQFARSLASGINSGTEYIRQAARRAVQQAKKAAEAAAGGGGDGGGDGGGSGSGDGIAPKSAIIPQAYSDAQIIGNAMRSMANALTEASGGAQYDNRRMYDQRNSGNVTVNVDKFVTNDTQDVRALALEIDTFERRKALGYGG